MIRIPITTESILSRLPAGTYADHYQPDYPDKDALQVAIHELRETTPVTAPEHIDELRMQLADIAEGNFRPIVVAGRCAEPVDITVPIPRLVQPIIASHRLVLKALPGALAIQRGRGQNTKPRSQPVEALPDGSIVPAYMGDAVNDRAVESRAPDPSRMVAAALQARDIEQTLTEAVGTHLPAAHEALLLPYELSFLRTEEGTGQQYLLSADLPWVGLRTNAASEPHVRLLRGLENPVGVKIGANSTAEHIQALRTHLNPEAEPGKLVLMLRIGSDRVALRGIVQAIKRYAPESILLYDIHGATRTAEDGTKIRAVSDIIGQTEELAEVCARHHLRLHGVHLETTTDQRRIECVDTPDQRSVHPGGIDPQLNPAQTAVVLHALAKVL